MSEILRVEHVVKVYGNGVMANKDINFSADRGEIHAICGENGAGKSTLMKMLYGIEQPSEGSIYVKGEKVELKIFCKGHQKGNRDGTSALYARSVPDSCRERSSWRGAKEGVMVS